MKDKALLKPDDLMGEGDTSLILDLLPPEIALTVFEKVREEVSWNTMYHRGKAPLLFSLDRLADHAGGEVPRLVAVQGEVDVDGSFPIYRHPSDSSPPLRPFSPTVSLIRQHVERVLQHPVNHVLIQHYRTGADYISEHSDKTIDIARGSRIVNISLGAQRVMTLRTKKEKRSARSAAAGAARRASTQLDVPPRARDEQGVDAQYPHRQAAIADQIGAGARPGRRAHQPHVPP
ncbi:hypothetical protein EVG20_g11679, partial [Dentipellis fragilis]